MYKNSKNAFRIAKDKIPGGVNSPVRAFKSVDGSPIFFKKGLGSKMIDIDNNEYIDCISSWGPLIFGHCNKNIIKSINNTVESGSTFGACTTIETEMADKITQYIPSVEKVRMVNSGTEATMSAIRLARGFTKKELIIKFSSSPQH